MMSAILIHSGGSVALNVFTLCALVAVAIGGQMMAVAIHQLRGGSKLLAHVGLNVAALLIVVQVAKPHAAEVIAAFIIECGCEWWNWLCCLI